MTEANEFIVLVRDMMRKDQL